MLEQGCLRPPSLVKLPCSGPVGQVVPAGQPEPGGLISHRLQPDMCLAHSPGLSSGGRTSKGCGSSFQTDTAQCKESAQHGADHPGPSGEGGSWWETEHCYTVCDGTWEAQLCSLHLTGGREAKQGSGRVCPGGGCAGGSAGKASKASALKSSSDFSAET